MLQQGFIKTIVHIAEAVVHRRSIKGLQLKKKKK